MEDYYNKLKYLFIIYHTMNLSSKNIIVLVLIVLIIVVFIMLCKIISKSNIAKTNSDITHKLDLIESYIQK